ncbi:GTP-binding protein [Exiguobacterium sp. Leaf187]|uniref:flagellar biosynthesis protein FlhF n=1 Tax=Exiguobacterium TaxID=33986 RepID=UPI0006F58179|nr:MULTISPECIES: GTP-binding protein [Exiguobacterium]KQS19332.1 GTP-binding protein [Exiguobacterium sp. Leaf187]MCQ4089904.1 GTP-binding protein [Exiguobacterium sp. LL15]
MIVKKIVADTVAEAMERVKQELGEEAIILNTRHIKVGGIFGVFAKRKVELVGSVDEHVEDKRTVKVEQPNRVNLHVNQIEQRSIVERPTIITTGERPLPRELRQYAKLLAEPALNQLAEHLHEKLVSTYYQTQQAELNTVLLEEVQAKIRTKTTHSKFIMLTGPTGVGKTTTIAKLAAHFTLTEKKRVGLITTDTYRISAIEQLNTYADILGIPIHVAYDLNDFEQAKEALQSCDIVLIDTAGRNFLDVGYVEQLKSRHTFEETDVFLVLSLTAKYQDLLRMYDRFQSVPVSGIIFSKADETSELWSIVGLAEESDVPIYCITTGQEVPEDILFSSVEEISQMIVERGMG